MNKPGMFRSWAEAALTLVAAIGLALVLWLFAVVFVVLLTPPPGS